MKLSELMPLSHVKADLQAKDRWEAIEELLQVLVSADALQNNQKEAASKAILARERSMSTGIGGGIAIPHAGVAGLEKAVAALGRSEAGIEFESMDGAPVRLVILLLVPQHQTQLHLKTLATLARFLNSKTQRQQLLEADTAEKLEQILEAEKQVEL
jgi:mannitol/fructose-specific phosphotransferase system IIA component (Ntr-type)